MMMLFLFLKEEGGRIYLIYYLKKEREVLLRELRSCCFVELGTKLYSKMVKYNRKKKMHGFYIKRK